MSDRHICKAKRTDNGEWVEGYVTFPCTSDNEGNPLAYCFYAVDEFGWYAKVIVSAETVCQYTGLPDKNGKKVWENDIVKEDFGLYKAVIRFGEFENQILKNIGFNLDWGSRVGYRQDLPYWTDKIEVVGNIFDNPELLKGGAE